MFFDSKNHKYQSEKARSSLKQKIKLSTSRYLDSEIVFHSLDSRGQLFNSSHFEKLFKLVSIIFDDEEQVILRELQKIESEKMQKNEEFNFIKNVRNNFNIFKANFELIFSFIGNRDQSGVSTRANYENTIFRILKPRQMPKVIANKNWLGI